MNWFQRHLNWTWFLAAIVGSYVLGLIFGLIAGSTNPYAFYTSLGTLYWLMYSLSALLVLIISIWVLRRKSQSLWWLLILLVPFVGWIIFLCLENHSEFAELRDTGNRVVGPPPKRAVPPPKMAGPPPKRMGPPPKMMAPPPKRAGIRERTDWD